MKHQQFNVVRNEEEDREIEDLILATCKKFSMDHCTLFIQCLGTGQIFASTTLPEDWQELYLEHGFFPHDPTIHIAAKSNKPVDWKILEQFDSLGLISLYSHRGYGQRGLTVPIRSHNGIVSTFKFSTIRDDEWWEDHIEKIRNDLVEQCKSINNFAMSHWNVVENHSVEFLSGKESEILRLAAAGLSQKDIANEYQTSTKTIETIFRSIKKKLRAKSPGQAIARAVALDWIYVE